MLTDIREENRRGKRKLLASIARRKRAKTPTKAEAGRANRPQRIPVCTENPIGVDDAPESPKLAE